MKRDFSDPGRARPRQTASSGLDNAATTQKPRSVIDPTGKRISTSHENSNIHRAAHALAARATDAYEAAREKTRRIPERARDRQHRVRPWRDGKAINLVAAELGDGSYPRRREHEIVITWLEHHANIVPWQQLAAGKRAPCSASFLVDADRGQVILGSVRAPARPESTRLVAVTQVSNALGTVVPVREMTEMAHRYGACVLVDGAQAVSHQRVDVQAIDCEFYVFSGHKVFAPTGIGVLYGKLPVLEAMPPWQGGGNMISDVRFERTSYQPPPARFEAGTGNIADAVGLGAALDYVSALGIDNIARYEHELLEYATGVPARYSRGSRMIGTPRPKRPGCSPSCLRGLRTEDVGAALDREGIAVRSGHHCAGTQPILRRFGLESTVRAVARALQHARGDIDALAASPSPHPSGQSVVRGAGDAHAPSPGGLSASRRASRRLER